jgi:hypothetical protein
VVSNEPTYGIPPQTIILDPAQTTDGAVLVSGPPSVRSQRVQPLATGSNMPPAPAGQDWPHTIICVPVHTAPWSTISGTCTVLVAVQVAGRVGVAGAVGESGPDPEPHADNANGIANATAKTRAGDRRHVLSKSSARGVWKLMLAPFGSAL